ncbi:DUF309 domain-containing protein [Oscillatoriales cyanobacterium LEGE 11467]|uniref:DUF309 domain-containing protein n=1 Tax=Zarconia navalis LEGE 11467 TaxID=1828826 RepID=A0A928Z5Y3_9CYAN|nr:DUF309 domain-containing protein [Zarconia navalis]MBE9039787.1 DUF309 domain-containing protein [Zarconia navalis LEGE 11467]
MCSNLLPVEFWQGVEEFNQRQFYACHDTLEAIWLESGDPQKTFYQGILQIAVACYHLSNHNWKGALMLLGEGIHRLRKYEPDYGGINIENLVDCSVEMLNILQQAGEDNVVNLASQFGLEDGRWIEDRSSLSLPKIEKIL